MPSRTAKKQKPTAVVAPEPTVPPPTPQQVPTEAAPAPLGPDGQPLPVVYDCMTVKEYSTTSPAGPITAQDWKVILGWETESEFQARKARELGIDLATAKAQWVFGDVFHCRNTTGEKVRCNANAGNRPFDEKWCEDLVHTVLVGQWAGPHTIPSGTVNGETVRVSKYGRVLSGQHQGSACILADEVLHKARLELGHDVANEKYPAWRGHNHCFLETILITGMSEDPRVLMTVDYVKPRTAADVFYTSGVFRESTPPQRKELCRMLSTAVDVLWDRTDTRGYKTHPEIVAFLERHRRLLQLTSHLFVENSEDDGTDVRRISKLRLSPGLCAALGFLQGCSGAGTDGDVYRNEEPAPSEAKLDWSMYDRAEEFWVCLARAIDFVPVRQALGRLAASDPNSEANKGMGGRLPEKLALLCKAWEVFRDSPPTAGTTFSMDDLKPGGPLYLHYSDLDDKGNKLPDGQIKLLDIADFGGIDCPRTTAPPKANRREVPDPPAPTASEIEAAAAEARARRAGNGS